MPQPNCQTICSSGVPSRSQYASLSSAFLRGESLLIYLSFPTLFPPFFFFLLPNLQMIVSRKRMSVNLSFRETPFLCFPFGVATYAFFSSAKLAFSSTRWSLLKARMVTIETIIDASHFLYFSIRYLSIFRYCFESVPLAKVSWNVTGCRQKWKKCQALFSPSALLILCASNRKWIFNWANLYPKSGVSTRSRRLCLEDRPRVLVYSVDEVERLS